MSVTFDYRARTLSGERVAGTMRALDRGSALAMLRERMLVPSKLESKASAFSLSRLFARAKPTERLAFFRAYAALEQAGVDFSNAFELLIAQTRTSRMRDALSSIQFDVERGGEKLWAAMSHRPDEFTDLEVAMVAAGEEAGNREEIFDRLATFLERDERMRKKLAAALLYPAIVLIAAFLISVYLLFVVIPQFAALFSSFGVAQSAIMTAILAIADVLLKPYTVAGVLIATATGFTTFSRAASTREGSLAFDALRLRVPLLGEALRKTTIARLCRVIATLLDSGVNLVRALEVSVPVAESPIFANAIELARERLSGGSCASLDEALAASGQFPPLLLGFVRTGGMAGNIPHMLVKLAEYYEDDVESMLSALPTIVQTVVTLALGIVVAAIVYMIYVPLSTLSTSIH